MPRQLAAIHETYRWPAQHLENIFSYQPHIPGQVKRYLPNLVAQSGWYLLKDRDDVFRPGPAYDSDNSPFPAMGLFVGDNGILFSMGKTGLIDGNPATEVLRKDQSFPGILPMFSLLKAAELIPVIPP